jgi:hypothetical protein
MRSSNGITSSEGESTTHMSPFERRCTSLMARATLSHARYNLHRIKTSVFFIRRIDSYSVKIRKLNDESSRRLKMPETDFLPNSCRKQDSNQLMDPVPGKRTYRTSEI